MTDEQENDELQEMIGDAAARLGEHFESVLILATRTAVNEKGRNGVIFSASSGSVFACDGAAASYVAKRTGFDEARGAQDFYESLADEDDEEEETA